VVRSIPKAEVNRAYETLVYFYGAKCGWQKKNSDGTADIEFVHMTKVYPSPTQPWEWCGTSVIFEDWRMQKEGQIAAAHAFKCGDEVAFAFKGEQLRGLVWGAATRVTVVVKNRGKFYVPASGLRLV
jgi:hypothetical protein